MSVMIQSGRLQNLPVADAENLSAALALMQAGIGDLNRASGQEIAAHARRMGQALAEKNSIRSQAQQQVQMAQVARAEQLWGASRQALESVSDLLMALAVQTGNPQLVAAPTGAELQIDTGRLVVQEITAETAQGRIECAWVLFEGRAAMLECLPEQEAPVFSQRRLALAHCLGRALLERGRAQRDEARLKQRLAALQRAVAALAFGRSGIPADPESMRDWMRLHLQTGIRFLQQLQDNGA